ncbi:hypothetical protein YC2023_076629 [Brassica napus]
MVQNQWRTNMSLCERMNEMMKSCEMEKSSCTRVLTKTRNSYKKHIIMWWKHQLPIKPKQYMCDIDLFVTSSSTLPRLNPSGPTQDKKSCFYSSRVLFSKKKRDASHSLIWRPPDENLPRNAFEGW